MVGGKEHTMKPVPETSRALSELAPYGDVDLAADLDRTARRVQAVVPDCVGFSLSLLAEGLTFTLAATSEEIAALDAVQYLDGGPCVDAFSAGTVLSVPALDVADEAQWGLFALAGAAAGVVSTLSLPIQENGEVTGGVNLYAASPNAFTGHHDELAGLFGAWAPGAVSNADLPFHTRTEAAKAPKRLEDQDRINQATGVVMAAHRVDAGTARTRIREAAARAGVPELGVALAVLRKGRLA
jgi:GAF domain-containing protein